MANRRDDYVIVLPPPKDRNDLPVWDAYIQNVYIDGDIPSFISERILTVVYMYLNQNPLPKRFSGTFKSDINTLVKSVVEDIYDELSLRYTTLQVVRMNYSLRVTTENNKPFDIWVVG